MNKITEDLQNEVPMGAREQYPPFLDEPNDR